MIILDAEAGDIVSKAVDVGFECLKKEDGAYYNSMKEAFDDLWDKIRTVEQFLECVKRSAINVQAGIKYRDFDSFFNDLTFMKMEASMVANESVHVCAILRKINEIKKIKTKIVLTK